MCKSCNLIGSWTKSCNLISCVPYSRSLLLIFHFLTWANAQWVPLSTLTYSAEFYHLCLCASGTIFICTIHIHIAAITTIITHDLLPCGLVAQSVEQRTIKSGGPAEVEDFFLCLVRSPISLLGLTLSGKLMGSL